MNHVGFVGDAVASAVRAEQDVQVGVAEGRVGLGDALRGPCESPLPAGGGRWRPCVRGK